MALNLPRGSDWELLPALLETQAPVDDWVSLAALIRSRAADELVDRARMIGLACARADVLPAPPPSTADIRRIAPAVEPTRAAPVVVDLSALWAGPLAAHLWERGGATVIKVESPTRLDGARGGDADFYALLNQGKRCLLLDLTVQADRRRLLKLIGRADIVIESSRPRALRHLGIAAETLIAAHPGLSWMAISGYGRDAPQENWVGYGDDTAAAARLGWECWRNGGGVLVSLALRDVASAWLHRDRADLANHRRALAAFHRQGYAPPVRRRPDGYVAGAGAHNAWPIEALVAC